MVWSPFSPRDSQEFYSTPQFKSINYSVLSSVCGPLSHPYMTTGKIIALTRWAFVSKVMSLIFNMRRQWHPTPVHLPGKSHGWRSLEGCSPWGHWGLDMTEWLHFHSSLSCIGEGNGNPLQCSCLENPRDGGARWAAVFGVTQSWTRLKRLSSSSSNNMLGLESNVSAF